MFSSPEDPPATGHQALDCPGLSHKTTYYLVACPVASIEAIQERGHGVNPTQQADQGRETSTYPGYTRSSNLSAAQEAGPLHAPGSTATVLFGTGIDFPFPVHVCEEIEGSISGCLGLHKGCDDGYCLQNGSLWRWGEGERIKARVFDQCLLILSSGAEIGIWQTKV